MNEAIEVQVCVCGIVLAIEWGLLHPQPNGVLQCPECGRWYLVEPE